MNWENGEKERESEEKKDGMQGGIVSRARLSRVCPSRLMEEGGRCQLSCKLREVLIPIQIHHGHDG